MNVEQSQISPGFKSILEEHPAIRLASDSDSDELHAFLNSLPMSMGSVQLNIVRGRDFFSLLRKQGDSYLSFMVTEGSKICGLASVVYRHSYVASRKAVVGYLQDLRLSPNITSALRAQFFSFYAKALQFSAEMPETAFCKFYYSAILKENLLARKALSRAQSPIKYVHFATYASYLLPTLPLQFFGQKKKALGQDQTLQAPKLKEQAEVLAFFELNATRNFLDVTPDDFQRILPNAEVVAVRNEGELVAACLLTTSAPDRAYAVKVPSLGLSFEAHGLYPFGITLRRGLTPTLHETFLNKLLTKAILRAQTFEGTFFGMAVPNTGFKPARVLRLLPKVCLEGSIYRVYHRDWPLNSELMSGFLRPSDTLSLELGFL